MTECTFPACLCYEAHQTARRMAKLAVHFGLSHEYGPEHIRPSCPLFKPSFPFPSRPAEFHLKERWRKYEWHE